MASVRSEQAASQNNNEYQSVDAIDAFEYSTSGLYGGLEDLYAIHARRKGWSAVKYVVFLEERRFWRQFHYFKRPRSCKGDEEDRRFILSAIDLS